MSHATTDQALAEALRLHNAGNLRDAEAIYRRVLQQQPTNAVALHLLGVLAFETGHPIEAEQLVRRAVTVQPSYAVAHSNLANILNTLGRSDDAISAAKHAISLSPQLADAHQNLAVALMAKGELVEAIASIEATLAIEPNHVSAIKNLAKTMLGRGHVSEAVPFYRRAVELAPHDVAVHDDLIFYMQFDPGCDELMARAEKRRWWERHGAPLPRPTSYPNDRDPDRKLRVGYVSPHFRNHVVGLNMLPLLKCHRRSQFEITLYSNDAAPTEATKEFQSLSDRWRDIIRMTDEQVTQQIRDDGIDILVDLALHMPGNRLQVFARQPAPVQLSFAAYPGFAAVESIQYRLTDAVLDRPSERGDSFNQPLYLRSFWCYRPTGDEPVVNELPALQNGFITFGCLNDVRKVNDDALRLWARVLREIPSSRLILLTQPGRDREHVLEVFASEEIDRSRIEWVMFNHRPLYLAYYQRIDIALDTLPYNGHTTTLDALFMGVPTLTLIGKSPVGRAGLSQLTNLDMKTMAAENEEDFVWIATTYAREPAWLADLRRNLRLRMQLSPLCDGASFANAVEIAYRKMWLSWCEQQR